MVLIREGSLLDSDRLAELAAFVEERGGCVWIERVLDSDQGCGIYIEDGSVRATKEPEPAAV